MPTHGCKNTVLYLLKINLWFTTCISYANFGIFGRFNIVSKNFSLEIFEFKFKYGDYDYGAKETAGEKRFPQGTSPQISRQIKKLKKYLILIILLQAKSAVKFGKITHK